MIVRPDRRALAAAVIVCWVVGIVMLARRRADVPEATLLARGVRRLEPVTYFYVLSQSGRKIGFGSSGIDTSAIGFTAHDMIRTWVPIAGDSEPVTLASTAYLSRGFALDSFAVSVSGRGAPVRLRGTPAAGSRVILPYLAPIALMLSHTPRVGLSAPTWLYDPVARRVERVTLGVAAESVFSVVDSARFDSTQHLWTPAHADTVRSWKITTPTGEFTAWVDSEGRIVAATEPGGATLVRTAYEIAALNPKPTTH